MTSRFISPFYDVGSGIKPPSGAKLFFFEDDGVTPKDTYTTKAATVANTNPVIADSVGVFPAIYIKADYLVTLKDKNDSQIYGLAPIEENSGASDLTLSYIFDTVALFKASLIEFPDGKIIHLKDRGADFTKITGTGTANDLNIIASTSVNQSIDIIITDVMNFKMFGAVGDNVAVDTDAIAKCIELAPTSNGDELTYLVTGILPVPANRIVNLNGASINAQYTSQIPCFNVIGDNVEIFGGTITVVGTVMGGYGGSLNCIVAGDQSKAGFKHLHFHDLTVSTNRNDAGASIGLLGECTNFTIENITVPDNANCRNIIGVEWGGTAVIDGTGHPHDGVIKNIKGGKLTFPSAGTAGFGYLVWISAAFNVEVSNLMLEEGFGLMQVSPGDNGNTFAPDKYKELVGTGITLDNAGVTECFGYGVRAIGKSDGSVDSSLSVTNLKVTKKVALSGNVFGFQTEFSKNTKLKGFEFVDVLYSTGADAVRPVIESGSITGSEIFGMGLGSSGGDCVSPRVRNVHFNLNNTLEGTGTGVAALTLSNVTDADIAGCTFGDTGVTETQKWSITGTTSTLRPNINNNPTNSLLSGGVSYIFGGSSNTEIEASGANNTSASGITNTSGSPIFQIDGFGKRSFGFTITPVAGAYKLADKAYFTSPVAGGKIGAVCVTAGSPGTWKSFGVIDA